VRPSGQRGLLPPGLWQICRDGSSSPHYEGRPNALGVLGQEKLAAVTCFVSTGTRKPSAFSLANASKAARVEGDGKVGVRAPGPWKRSSQNEVAIQGLPVGMNWEREAVAAVSRVQSRHGGVQSLFHCPENTTNQAPRHKSSGQQLKCS